MSADNAILEAAARALEMEDYNYHDPEDATRLASVIVAAVTPLIRAAALEEAAGVAEEYPDGGLPMEPPWVKAQIAGAIRTLKEQP